MGQDKIIDIDILEYLQFIIHKGIIPSDVTLNKAVAEIESLREKLASQAQPTPSENGDELLPQDIVYNLTVHDLMSAFSKWELINAIPKTKESPEAVQPVK